MAINLRQPRINLLWRPRAAAAPPRRSLLRRPILSLPRLITTSTPPNHQPTHGSSSIPLDLRDRLYKLTFLLHALEPPDELQPLDKVQILDSHAPGDLHIEALREVEVFRDGEFSVEPGKVDAAEVDGGGGCFAFLLHKAGRRGEGEGDGLWEL